MCVASHDGHLSLTGTVMVFPLNVTCTEMPWHSGSLFGLAVVHHWNETATRFWVAALMAVPHAPNPLSL